MIDMGEAPVPGLVPITIEPERLQLIGIRTAKVSRQNLGGKINITGFVTPDETRLKNISTRVNGWALNLFVDKTGQFVEAGKPLMALYSQDLYQAEQDFMVARDALKGDSSDAALKGMRRQIYDAARERLHLLGLSDGQVGEIEKSDAPSPQMMITSPFSGYVLEKSILPGQYISPDQILFTLADLSKVWVLGDIYEQDISYVHTGQKASVSLITYPGEVFEGVVSYIYPSVSEKTRTLKVRIELSNAAMRLRPGMYAQVSLERDGGEMLAVPTEAVIDAGKTRYAFVIHDGRHFEPRLLKIGHSSDDFTEVLSGLKVGEEVVTSANFLIDSESRLKAAVSGMAGMPGMPDMAEDQNRGSAAGDKR
jgi:RND family efflux transporter MFP subunit